MTPYLEVTGLKADEKAVVEKVYRKYDKKTGKWLSSDTPKTGYDIVSYRPSKGSIRLFYRTKEGAQREADKYNRRLAGYKRRELPQFPDEVTWYTFPGSSEFRNDKIWMHPMGSWLYEHGYERWHIPSLLLENDFYKGFPLDGKSTADFFDVLLALPRFSKYYRIDKKIYYRR